MSFVPGWTKDPEKTENKFYIFKKYSIIMSLKSQDRIDRTSALLS